MTTKPLIVIGSSDASFRASSAAQSFLDPSASNAGSANRTFGIATVLDAILFSFRNVIMFLFGSMPDAYGCSRATIWLLLSYCSTAGTFRSIASSSADFGRIANAVVAMSSTFTIIAASSWKTAIARGGNITDLICATSSLFFSLISSSLASVSSVKSAGLKPLICSSWIALTAALTTSIGLVEMGTVGFRMVGEGLF